MDSAAMQAAALAATIRLTDALLGVVCLGQSLEHLCGTRSERWMHGLRLLPCLALMFGWQAEFAMLWLLVLSTLVLIRFQGPYNGGSDRLTLLMLCCLCGAHWAGDSRWRELCLAYLAAQVLLSYFMAGWVKIINPAWRSGQALREVFAWSVYPVSESLRGWARHPRLLWGMGWCVMLLELLLPLCLFDHVLLRVALLLAALFHLANACLFGLNRFFWIWLASYPSLLWLQQRLLSI